MLRLVHRRRRAFTLVELLLVITIIGILIVVTTPTFFGIRDRSKDVQVGVDVVIAYQTAKAVYSPTEHYPAVDTLVARMQGYEPSIPMTTQVAGLSEARTVYVSRDDDQQLTLCARSRANRVLCLRVHEQGSLMVNDSLIGPTTVLASQVNGAAVRSSGETYTDAACVLPTTTTPVQTGCGTGRLGWATESN